MNTSTTGPRPRERDRVTVHFEVDGVPLNDIALATSVSDRSLVLKRSGSLRDAAIEPGTRATVLFTAGERLVHWVMRVEEVLPSSFFLLSTREPGEGERREFVRARVPMRARVRTVEAEAWLELVDVRDLSAAGFRVPGRLPWTEGSRVQVELVPDAVEPDAVAALDAQLASAQLASDHAASETSPGRPPIRAVARVVRRVDDTALEFVELGSADENRVADLVFGVREAALKARLTGQHRN